VGVLCVCVRCACVCVCVCGVCVCVCVCSSERAGHGAGVRNGLLDFLVGVTLQLHLNERCSKLDVGQHDAGTFPWNKLL
jgi:hypothetical protein